VVLTRRNPVTNQPHSISRKTSGLGIFSGDQTQLSKTWGRVISAVLIKIECFGIGISAVQIRYLLSVTSVVCSCEECQENGLCCWSYRCTTVFRLTHAIPCDLTNYMNQPLLPNLANNPNHTRDSPSMTSSTQEGVLQQRLSTLTMVAMAFAILK
jgi:hypothetical protein